MPAVITLLSDIMGGTVKIFKKCSPNGRVYLYLGNREFVSCDGAIPPVTGIVNIQDHHDTLKELYTLYDVEAKKKMIKVLPIYCGYQYTMLTTYHPLSQ